MKKNVYKSNLSMDENVLMAVVRAAELFKRAHGGIFRNYGLSFPQYNILRVLEASLNGQNRISEVGRIMLVPGANMTGLAKRMEKGGFIIRKSDPRDERVTILEITPKGTRTLKNIKNEKDEWLERILDGFSTQEKSQFLNLVKRLIKNNVQLTAQTQKLGSATGGT